MELSDNLSSQAQDTVKVVTMQGFYWYWAMDQEYSYAGIRTKPLTNTLVCGKAGPNQLSQAIENAYKSLQCLTGMKEK